MKPGDKVRVQIRAFGGHAVDPSEHIDGVVKSAENVQGLGQVFVVEEPDGNLLYCGEGFGDVVSPAWVDIGQAIVAVVGVNVDSWAEDRIVDLLQQLEQERGRRIEASSMVSKIQALVERYSSDDTYRTAHFADDVVTTIVDSDLADETRAMGLEAYDDVERAAGRKS